MLILKCKNIEIPKKTIELENFAPNLIYTFYYTIWETRFASLQNNFWKRRLFFICEIQFYCIFAENNTRYAGR